MIRFPRVRTPICLALIALLSAPASLLAADHAGQVTFAGLAVPGATVTMTQGEKRVTAITDADGIYRFTGVDDGVWSLLVEMLGFAPLKQDITIPSVAPA